MHTNRSTSPRRIALASALAAGVLLLAGCSDSGDDSLPACPVSRAGSIDMVPAGVRPCVLYGGGSTHQGGAVSSTTRRPTTGATVKPGNQPAAPKAVPKSVAPPKAAPKAPPAPAVKAPTRR